MRNLLQSTLAVARRRVPALAAALLLPTAFVPASAAVSYQVFFEGTDMSNHPTLELKAAFVLPSTGTVVDDQDGNSHVVFPATPGTYNGKAGFADVRFFEGDGSSPFLDGFSLGNLPGFGAVEGTNARFYDRSGSTASLLAGTFKTVYYFEVDAGFVPDSALNGAVPEPAGWALMLTGFGMVGACLRTRRPARDAVPPLRPAR